MKKKKVVIHYGNILIVLVGLIILGFGIKYMIEFFTNDKKEEVVMNKHLSSLGYSNKEIENIEKYLSEEDIDKIDKKYDNLDSLVSEKYFHIENLERYIDYKNNNSNYSNSEVIMNVNISIDKPFYDEEVIKNITDTEDTLILVNKYNQLPSSYEPSDLINVEGVKMKSEAGNKLLEMMEAMRNDGLKIIAQSGYRSYETQKSIYNNKVSSRGVEEADKVSARPGHSEHQTGLAIDLSIDGTLEKTFGDTKQYEWLNENAYKYGFIMRYPLDKIYITGYDYEPWHYRYVGLEVASVIKNENLTYEEYLVKYKGLY